MAKESVQPIVIDASRQEAEGYGADYSFMKHAEERMESLMRWQLDMEEKMQEVRRTLKGYSWDKKSDDYTRDDTKKRVMNDEGVDAVMDKVDIAVANKNTPFSNITENGARRIAKELHKSVARLMYEKEIDFDVDRSEYSPFARSISHFSYLLLTRPVDEGERQFLQPILRYLEDMRTQKRDEKGRRTLFGRGG